MNGVSSVEDVYIGPISKRCQCQVDASLARTASDETFRLGRMSTLAN